jgi:hypothetical protein
MDVPKQTPFEYWILDTRSPINNPAVHSQIESVIDHRRVLECIDAVSTNTIKATHNELRSDQTEQASLLQ